MRLAAAIAVIAVAFSTALYVHQRHVFVLTPGALSPHRVHPSWEDPVAVLIAIGGIALAVGIVAYRNPRFAKPS